MASIVINKKRFTKKAGTDITNQIITTSFTVDTTFAVPISKQGDEITYDIGVSGVDGAGSATVNISITTIDLTKGDLTDVALFTTAGASVGPAVYVPRESIDGTRLVDVILFHLAV